MYTAKDIRRRWKLFTAASHLISTHCIEHKPDFLLL